MRLRLSEANALQQFAKARIALQAVQNLCFSPTKKSATYGIEAERI